MKRIFVLFLILLASTSWAQHSVARQWNEALLEAIRDDFARPTVHARNLYHSSILMYDAWSLFDDASATLFLGKAYGGFECPFEGIPAAENIDEARSEIMSYALYRLLTHRFQNSPGAAVSLERFRVLHQSMGYDPDFTATDYSEGSYAALGNYLGTQMIAFGMQDGANEAEDYGNLYYEASNPPLVLAEYQDPTNIDPNRWQPLSFDLFVDQSGNTVPLAIPEFLSPEWGTVIPFALEESSLVIRNNGFDSYLYYNIPEPPKISDSAGNGIEDPYKWHFAMVIAWSAHLDPDDPTEIDISPASLGNVDIAEYPETFEDYKAFYNFTEGGDLGRGHAFNPHTFLPYSPQIVKRADYARALAEFWADGPDSETPPGHWFTILNYVSDHPELVKKFGGNGQEINDLEWDVKAYLALGGAMHDSAIATWAIKGYFDYVRPITAIRYMCAKGQSSDPELPGFDPHGIPLIPGLIELIDSADPLAGSDGENVGKIKIYAWRGPDYINDPDTDTAGVGWILGTHWWPYQRGTFVTPPFAGYVSGHSTFSRAAAEILTLLTGNPFFPGGMGTFDIEANEFLVFEEGPSNSFTLQWATYGDASDQTSLSRIWGGIHPPIDDIPGRLIGEDVGRNAFAKAEELFHTEERLLLDTAIGTTVLYPSPFENRVFLNTDFTGNCTIKLYGMNGITALDRSLEINGSSTPIDLSSIATGLYILVVTDENGSIVHKQKVLKAL